MIEIWQDCSRVLERELTPQQYVAWIKPLRAIAYDPDARQLRLGAPNRLKLDAVRSQFAARIRAAAAELAQHPVDVHFEVSPTLAAEPAAEPAEQPGERAVAGADAGPRILNDGAPLPSTGPVEHMERARLQPGLTFDTFVTGKANQLARAAAMQVAENPGGSYNPLFLYGGVGLGKTHLVHAVGNGILARKPNAKVRYIHAEQYVSDVVRAYQKKAFDEFKRYYHSLDLLLIDDIQFFGGKSRTQEEFFYAFEALVAGKKQIIITSDTYPKELKDIEDRLVSRFSVGLTVGIEPPELEMRVAILLKKAELERAELSGGSRLLHRQEPAQQRPRARGRAAQDPCLRLLPRPAAVGRAGARGAEGPARRQHRPDHGRTDPEDGRRLLQDQGRRHVQQATAELDRHAAPDRHVPGQGNDPEEPARARRAVRRPRPHHRAARGAQDQPASGQGQRTEPRAARSRAGAEGLNRRAGEEPALWTGPLHGCGQPWENAGLPESRPSCPAVHSRGAALPSACPQRSGSRKSLSRKAGAACPQLRAGSIN
jgi:chromosomal replication initiator protein DnaA